MFIFILLISILTLIYFLSMVCIQFSHITNINLQFGMDVTKLYSDDNFKDNHRHINKLIKNSAMLLYKITNTFK